MHHGAEAAVHEHHQEHQHENHHNHHDHEHMQHPEQITQKSEMKNYITVQDLVFVLSIAIILAVGIYTRIPLLKFFGFYEPDGFYHFSVIRAAVNNGFHVPLYLGISGWPSHAIVSEPSGLYWVTLLPYYFLRFFNFSYYDIMRLVGVAFGLLDVFAAYFLARFISKDKFFGILVMALVALSAGDAARTSALIYRGDGFATLFFIVSMIFLLFMLRGDSQRKRLMFMALSAIFLSIANVTWNGAAFATVVYIISFILIVGVAFILDKEDMLSNSGYMLGLFLMWFVLVSIYRASSLIIVPQPLTDLNFIPILVLLGVGWFIAFYLIRNAGRFQPYLNKSWKRFLLLFGFSLFAFALLDLFFPALILRLFVNNGFITTNSNFASTIEELVPPSYNFLYVSFGYVLFTTPMSAMVSIISYFESTVFIAQNTYLIFVILCLGFIPYFFMQVYDSGGWNKGNARIRFGISHDILVLISFFAVTVLLQISAIRFNSLLAIPLAIFSAFTIYWIAALFKNYKADLLGNVVAVIIVAIATFAFMYYVAAKGPLYSALAVLGGVAGIYAVSWIFKGNHVGQIVCYFLIIIFLLTIFYYDIIFGTGIAPADTINNNFIQAVAWIKNNTSTNSVFLTLWPDGSLIEGIGNRTSVTDSVGSQNASKANPFAAWILNSSPDPQFLLSKINGRPDYLLVRYNWLLETGGIFVESQLNGSRSNDFAYDPLTSVSELVNSSIDILKLSTADGKIQTVTTIHKTNNSIYSIIQSTQGPLPFDYIAFYNQDSGNYSLIKQTNRNTTVADGLLIIYSKNTNPNLPINITGSLIMKSDMFSSNLMKFLYLCGSNSCSWDNSIAKLQMVYLNRDTKIYKIIYNSTS